MADQEDNCSICLNIFTEPKIIDCGHIFCGDCLEDYYSKKYSKSKNFPCPLCRHNVDVPEGGIKMFPSTNSKKIKIDQESAAVPSTSRITEEELIDALLEMFSCDACKSCDSDIYKCIECNKYMCCSCKNTYHDKFCADHHVYIVQHQDEQTRGSTRHCTQHAMEKLEFYCKDCSVAICKTCLTPAHRDHDTLEIYDYRDEAEDELKKLRDDLEIKSSEFEEYVVEVNKKIDNMNISARTSCSKIDQHVKNICDVVFRRGEKLKKDLKKLLQEDEQKMKKIVDGTKELIGRMAQMAQNITDVLIGNCMHDIVDVLTIMKRQRDELGPRDIGLVGLQDVTSEHHTMGVDTKSLHKIVGEFRFARQTQTTLKHSFLVLQENGGTLSCSWTKEGNEWVYSPAFKLEDYFLYIRVKRILPDEINHGFLASFGSVKVKPIHENLCVGLYVNVGDSVKESTSCTVKAAMKLMYMDNGSIHKETKTKPSTQTFTSSIGILTWDQVEFYPRSSIECTATVGITTTTLIGRP